MKILKKIMPLAGLILACSTLNAQSLYDAERFMGGDLNGTARYVGMGGAMGALGGDITTIGTNPAGVGIYRSNDLNVSFGFSNVGNKATMAGTSTETDKFFGSFDNAGFVLALRQGDYTPVRFVNFGFNYNKQKSFDKNFLLNGGYSGNISQTKQFADLSEGIVYFEGSPNPYFNDQLGWLSVMAWDTYLMDVDEITTTTKKNSFPYKDEDGNQIYDESGNALYIDNVFFQGVGTNPNARYLSEERGGMHNYDFNMALNFNDRFYLGATVGVVNVDYSRTSIYSESSNYVDYSLENWFTTKGTGFNFKLGMIGRLTDNLRIGAAVHIPTFFKLTDYHGARMISDFGSGEVYEQDTYNQAYECVTDYKLVTPWKYNLSLGYTVGTKLALGAEYEYSDHSTAKLKYDDGEKMTTENDRIKAGLRGVNTIKLGAEYRIVPEFSVRAGYNYITASTNGNEKSYKNLPTNTTRTDTEYFSGKAINNFTFGFGYKGDFFYADMAYQYNHSKDEFYPFTVELEKQPFAKVTNNRHQLLFTLGMRF
ncbi:OmpP1/FadL family transporter [Bacteroides sp. 519]|uniref:OmpP1/FadL family transporter n=1 Tax=Bacteroides sp. 519 TaxID=2302937 RepID=UPI0013D0DD43|nr:outer membrane protein transport protein [Bacteroides sp. 519]NDV59390.1 hypothetical protein [Bacteroides sp. 519]